MTWRVMRFRCAGTFGPCRPNTKSLRWKLSRPWCAPKSKADLTRFALQWSKVVEPEGRDDDDDPHCLRCYILIVQNLAALEALRSISRRPVSGASRPHHRVAVSVHRGRRNNAASAVSQKRWLVFFHAAPAFGPCCRVEYARWSL